MKLEHTQTKSEVRQAIVRQIEEEIEQNPRNNYMVSLPAENWFTENMVLPIFWKQKKHKHTLHCYECDPKVFVRNLKNLPFTMDPINHWLQDPSCNHPTYITGKSENVEVIYQFGNLNVETLNKANEENAIQYRLIGWYDYCGYPIDYPEKYQTPIEDLMYAFNSYEDALIYVTHLFKFRNTRNDPKIKFNFNIGGKSGIIHNVKRFLSYCNGKYKNRNLIERCQIFQDLYVGSTNSPMLTAGWRTGSTEANHITLHQESYI